MLIETCQAEQTYIRTNITILLCQAPPHIATPSSGQAALCTFSDHINVYRDSVLREKPGKAQGRLECPWLATRSVLASLKVQKVRG